MLKLFNLKNLQLFAEPGTGEGTGGTPGTQGGTQSQTTVHIDYDQMAAAIEKRSSQTADSVLKGYLKQQGLSGEELDKAVNDYKTQKANAQTQKDQEFENYKTENAQLKAQILNSNIDSKLAALATAEGVSADKIPFMAKIITRDGLADDKGEVIEDKVKEAMNAVLKSFPDFKGNVQQENGFQQIGGSGNNQNTNTTEDQLDAIFGVKKK